MKNYTVQLTAYHKAVVCVGGGVATITTEYKTVHVPVNKLMCRLLSLKALYLEELGSRVSSRKVRLVYEA